MSDFLTLFTKEIKNNLPGYIAFSIINFETEEIITSHSSRSDFDVSVGLASSLQVAKSNRKALTASGITSDINEVLITLDTKLEIMDFSENEEFMCYLAVDSSLANLGMTRSLFNKYKKDIVRELN
ncbi:hypothetical protein [Tenacibaculum piscium]|uniref:Roadblock/LAMTOR2 domain-containing protein n=1 Tax=Tenacibaculum piscium TaxID=1458515 RepID=A0A2H1YJ86_9FLAO|nr:hypothetical protein [Tenacibaculum piscium]MBE7628779.1 hypothetical protein [Tenacibaculum piscium]MBE7669920.1 hypothetical protein [Tenacibaculum piscium]MBE7684485.1 hypothetical protein [Tenacibaculum piscium]MBE7689105.1 hypothetical protein [Tenacibaculum piscium]SOS75569.1 conserved hypothetical protein [Tenacibaculum piscium]